MKSASSFAPGRVELLGNHTDYNEGVVLSAAINLGVSAHGCQRMDTEIVLTSEGISGMVAADVDKLVANDGWADYPLGVAKVLKDGGYPIAGYEADFSSNLPLGAGLSSSAAIEPLKLPPFSARRQVPIAVTYWWVSRKRRILGRAEAGCFK